MVTADLHIHTNYCDGKSGIEEIILSAINKGLSAVGISSHGFTDFDTSYCIKAEKIPEYIKEIEDLKDKYKDKIKVLTGVEHDLYSSKLNGKYDYVIGSMHYIKAGDKYYSLDVNPEGFREIADTVFGGDIYALAEQYYSELSEVLKETKVDIIGHFDLITKYNEDGGLFDTKHPRYIAAWQKAIDEIINLNIPFEINTGAISRGYRTAPYPSLDIIEYIRDKGGKFILSSDSHSADTVAYQLSDWAEKLSPLKLNILNAK